MARQDAKLSFVEIREDIVSRLEGVRKKRTMYVETIDDIKYAHTPDRYIAAIDMAVKMNKIGGELKADMEESKNLVLALDD